jgi:hypothetical protein
LKSDFKLVLTDSIMLDLNSGGMIDYSPGKNGGLRRYRDATDLNKPGVSFKAKDLIGPYGTAAPGEGGFDVVGAGLGLDSGLLGALWLAEQAPS